MQLFCIGGENVAHVVIEQLDEHLHSRQQQLNFSNQNIKGSFNNKSVMNTHIGKTNKSVTQKREVALLGYKSKEKKKPKKCVCLNT